LAGAGRTVRVSVDRATELGVVSNVEPGGKVLSATVSASPPTQATIDPALTGLRSSVARRLTVTATAYSSLGPVVVPLVAASGSGTTSHGTASVPIDAGIYTPIEIDVTGVPARMLLTGVVSADGTASFAGLGASRLVDTDGDGNPDELD